MDNRQELKNEIAKLENERSGLINGDYFVCTEQMPYREMSIEKLREYRKQGYKEYMELLEGGVDENGKSKPGLIKLREQKKMLEKYPEKALETEAGKEAISKEKHNIADFVFNYLLKQMFYKFRNKLLESLKKYLFEPICEYMSYVFERKGVKMENEDKEWIKKNISFAVDNTIKYNEIGSAINDEIEQILPNRAMVDHAVEEEIVRRRGR